MKALNLCLLVSCGLGTALATAGCLQDYDEFQFGEGGAGSTATGQSTAGPGPTTTGPGQTTTTTTSGPTTTTSGPTTTNTTNTTNTVASTTMASTTSGGPVIDCDGDTCDIDGGETCCVDGSGNGSCSQGACGSDIPIECDEAADCDGGEVCCLHESNGNTLSIECETSCTGPDNDPLCGGDGDAACVNPTPNCTQQGDLPAGFESCQ